MRILKGRKRKQLGFTLVELLVVIAVMGLLFVIAIANFRGAEGSNNLKMDAEKLAGAFREAQNYAIAQQRVETAPGIGNFEVPFSFEVEINPNSKPGRYLINAFFRLGNNANIQTYTLSSGIEYGGIEASSGNGGLNDIRVTFVPPRGEAVFYSGSNVLMEEYIVVKLREKKENNSVLAVRIYNKTGTVVVFDPADGIIGENHE